MSAGAPTANFTLHGLATLLWAVASDETGMVVQSLTVNRKADSKEVRNIGGDYCAVGAGYGRKGDLRISAYKTAAFTAILGAALTVANAVGGNGIANAIVILLSVSDAMTNTDFEKIEISGGVYDLGTGAT